MADNESGAMSAVVAIVAIIAIAIVAYVGVMVFRGMEPAESTPDINVNLGRDNETGN